MFWLGATLAGCLLASLDDKRGMADDSPKLENVKSAALEPSATVVHRPDLLYRTVGDRKLMLDVIFPKLGGGPFPAVILLHGTGPANQGKEGMVPLAQELARQGYVAIAVSYRSKPEDAFPAPIQDVRCAIRWLRGQANQYKIDKDRIGVVGFSGGGTLACLLGMNGPVQNGDRVQAVVSFYGPTDFARLHEVCQAKLKVKETCFEERVQSWFIIPALEKWLGGSPSKVPESYALPSPVTHVTRNLPPFLLIHGAEDTMIPVEQSQRLATKLKESGNPVGLLIIGCAGHDFEEKDPINRRLAMAAVLAFLDDHLVGLNQNRKLANRSERTQDSTRLQTK
jgi:acetyl esterase/lipase